MTIILLKWLHIASALLLVGTGFGSAFYKFMADRSGDLRTIATTNRLVVLADWIFTTPTIVIQPATGIALAVAMGYPLTTPWLTLTYILYVLAGVCWVPVVVLQIRMARDARICVETGSPLPEHYRSMARLWFWLGIPAFLSMMVILYLMVARPGTWPF